SPHDPLRGGRSGLTGSGSLGVAETAGGGRTSSMDPSEAKGTLALIGGGDYEQSERVDSFLRNLAGGPDTSVVFLPTARPSVRMGEKFTEYFQSLGAHDVKVAPVYEAEDANNEDNARMLREAGLIYIGWGSDIRV